MLRSHLRTALRSLARRRGTAAINVAGLGLACAVALLFGLLAVSFLTYDAAYPGAESVYVVHHDIVTSQGERRVDETWVPLRPALQAEFPQIEAATRFAGEEHEVRVGERTWLQAVKYADDGYFRVFPFPFRQGDPETALAEPHAAVVAADAAEALFGDADPVGQRLVLDGSSEVVVTGVVEVPRNSSVQFDVLVAFAHAEQHLGRISSRLDNWGSSFLYTYVRLRDGADPAALEAAFGPFLDRYREPNDARIGLTPAAARRAEEYDLHTFATVFLFVAFGVLAIAAVNVTNLATARSLERAREIGVRKTLGAGRAEVAAGFLVESALVAGAAVLLGAALTQSALPWFNGMLEGFLTMRLDFAAWELWAALLGLAVLVTGLAGLYPAFFLARFQPVETLKGRLAARPAGARLRSGLVLFQFTLTVFLLACTLTIHRQVHHMRALGFDFGATPVVAVPASGEAFEDREAGRSAMQTLRDELRRDPAVAAASLSWGFPGAYWNTSTLRLGGTEERINVRTNWVDAHYFDLYGIDLVAGRGFAEARPGDGDRVAVVNEAFLEAFEWDTYEGKTLHPNYDATWEVVGVVEDFAYAAPTQPLGPVVHVFDGEPGFGWLSVRAATDDPQAVLALLEAAWPGTGARRALTTTFADDHYGEQFVAQDALLAFVTYAAGFAFVIAFIGLVGLAMLLAVQRTKEIGVRKVLGASVGQLVVLLVRGTAALVGGAAVLAAPLAVLVMGAWLEQYPYRVEVGAGPLVLVAALVLAAALLAVGGQAVRAAQADPVQALRSE